MRPPPLNADYLAYGVAATTLEGSALDRKSPKPSPRWWRWLVVAGVPGMALGMLAMDWARWFAQ